MGAWAGDVGGLRGTAEPLATAYDVALLDLDGVIYVGAEAVPHAAQSLATARELGQRSAFVTNNALRTPDVVAGQLRDLGVPAEAVDVVTSAQAAASVLSARLPVGSRVLLVGGEGLRVALHDRGLVPVSSADDDPVAVVTGHDPQMTWARLAEAALALGRGATWIASNTDANIPSRRGRLPGAGSVVALLSTATGRCPDEVAGKPHPALHRESVERTGARRPLVVGDRLDTDIEGAHAGGAASLLVLTGVTDPGDLLAAPPRQRPTHVAADLRGLLVRHPWPDISAAASDGAAASDRAAASVGTAHASRDGQRLLVAGEDPVDRLRAACVLAWGAADAGRPSTDVSGL